MYEHGNRNAGQSTATQIGSGSTSMTQTGGNGSTNYTQSKTGTNDSTATQVVHASTGDSSFTSTASSSSTLNENGASPSTDYSLRHVEGLGTERSFATSAETGVYTLTTGEDSSSSLTQTGSEGSAHYYNLDKVTAGYVDSTQVGDAWSGEYTLDEASGSTSTAIETLSHGSNHATFTEVLSEDNARDESGNEWTGEYSLFEVGTRGADFVDWGAKAGDSFFVTEGSSASYDRGKVGNRQTGAYSLGESTETDYSWTQTHTGSLSSFTLTGAGTDAASITEEGDERTGDYSRTEDGTDLYTLEEWGSNWLGSFSESLSGTDHYTGTEDGNHDEATFDRTTSGGGDWDRSATGSGAVLGSGSGTNTYTLTETGDSLAGHFSKTSSGSHRYNLIDHFNDVSNTGGGDTPGNITFHTHGLPFRDPGPQIVGGYDQFFQPGPSETAPTVGGGKVPGTDGKKYGTAPPVAAVSSPISRLAEMRRGIDAMWNSFTPEQQTAYNKVLNGPSLLARSKYFDNNPPIDYPANGTDQEKYEFLRKNHPGLLLQLQVDVLQGDAEKWQKEQTRRKLLEEMREYGSTAKAAEDPRSDLKTFKLIFEDIGLLGIMKDTAKADFALLQFFGVDLSKGKSDSPEIKALADEVRGDYEKAKQLGLGDQDARFWALYRHFPGTRAIDKLSEGISGESHSSKDFGRKLSPEEQAMKIVEGTLELGLILLLGGSSIKGKTPARPGGKVLVPEGDVAAILRTMKDAQKGVAKHQKPPALYEPSTKMNPDKPGPYTGELRKKWDAEHDRIFGSGEKASDKTVWKMLENGKDGQWKSLDSHGNGVWESTDPTVLNYLKQQGLIPKNAKSATFTFRNYSPDLTPHIQAIDKVPANVKIVLDKNPNVKNPEARAKKDYRAADNEFARVLNSMGKTNPKTGMPWTGPDIARYRAEKELTWHHVEDVNVTTGEGSMQLVPRDIHKYIYHEKGGRTIYDRALPPLKK